MVRRNEAREHQAERELGTTRVARGTAVLLVGSFLATITAVPALDLLAGDAFPRLEGPPTECSLEAFERALEDASAVADRLRPPVQAALLASLGLGNEQVYPGEGGWLFHRPGVDYATGPGFLDPDVLAARRRDADPCRPVPEPDPIPAIVDFAEQLRARGIALLLLPTPVKAVAVPERLARRDVVAPAHNPSYPRFLAALAREDVAFLDPTLLLLEEEDYLATDTHWRPEAVGRVAEALAGRAETLASLGPRTAAVGAGPPVPARNLGDLAMMLDLPEGQDRYPPERVTVRPVADRGGGPAPVLLLGDSFSNIYASREAFAKTRGGEALDWGSDAGLAAQLARALARPVDSIVRNAGGAFETREALARRSARAAARGEPDPLAGVRLVVWQFAVRELAQGDWRRIALPSSPQELQEPQEPQAPAPGAAEGDAEPGGVFVVGRVAAAASPPRPGSVPYAHALVAVHLTEVSGIEASGELLVYVYGMRDQEWTPAARWQPGERVALRLVPWEDETVQRELATLSRAELDDLDLLLLPAYYGELVENEP